MAVIVGTPHAVVQPAAGSCDDTFTVPGICTDCRQFDRWMDRTTTWAASQVSRFRAIVGSILTAHDEVLKSLCGFCATQPDNALNCDCVVQRYRGMGLPMVVDAIAPDDCALTIREELTLGDICVEDGEGAPITCWWRECRLGGCDPVCVRVELDPCNNPDHLTIVTRTLAAAEASIGPTGTAPAIIRALSVLFPDTTPQIISAQFGLVRASIGRPLTALERMFSRQLLALVPRGFGVTIELIAPC